MLETLKKQGWKVALATTVLTSAIGAFGTNRYLEHMLEPPEKVGNLPPPGEGSRRQQGLSSPEGSGPVADANGAPSGDKPGEKPGESPDGKPGDTVAGAGDASGAPPEAPVAGPESNVMPPIMEYEIILSRNLFDPEHPDSFVEPTQGPDGSDKTVILTPPLDVRLFGTVVAEPASFSWAIVSKNEDGAPQETASVGTDLYGQGTLISVRRRQIVVRRPDGTEQVVDPYNPATNTAPQVQASAGKTDNNGLGDTVRKVGENKYEIDAREIQAAMDNMDKVTQSARIVPSFENGNPVGFKIFRIKPDSFYNKLGLRNGDVINKINGFDINSTEKALQLLQILRTEKSLNLEMTRRGQKTNMEYTIR